MINLLADTKKSDIAAARVNLILTRYIDIIILAFLFLGGALFVSYTILTSIKDNADALIEANSSKTSERTAAATQQVEQLRSTLAQAQASLANEARYSQVLVKLGQALPSGTILDDLTLTTTNVANGVPTTITVYARTADDAKKTLQQLQTSGLFSSVVAGETKAAGGPEGYPVTAPFTVIFNRGNL